MSLTWPWALTALLAFPLLLGFRWWIRRRRRREAVRVSSVALIRAALPGRSLWRRRIPLWLFAVGLVVLGHRRRPPAGVRAGAVERRLDPAGDRRVRLDVLHRRRAQPADRRPGGRPRVHQGAGRRHPDRPGHLLRHRRPAGRADHRQGGAAGRRSTRCAPPAAPRSAWPSWPPSTPSPRSTRPSPPTGVEVADDGPGDPGEYQPDTIVVLTDGRNTQGVDPVTAAEEAAARHLRVYTIGFGTTKPAPMVCAPRPDQRRRRVPGRRAEGRGGFGGGGGRVPADRRGDADRGRRDDRRRVLPGRGRRGAQRRAAGPAEHHRAAASRTWRSPCGSRSPARCSCLVAVGLAQWWNRSTPLAVAPNMTAPKPDRSG